MTSTILPIPAKRTITFHVNSLNIKKTTTYDVVVQVLTWDRNKHEAGLNPLIGM